MTGRAFLITVVVVWAAGAPIPKAFAGKPIDQSSAARDKEPSAMSRAAAEDGAAARAAENWPQFRGPNGDGHGRAKGLPLQWSESKNVKWKTPIHDRGRSSPVIWESQVWVTTAAKDGKRLYAVCVDRGTGKIVHDIKVFDVEKPQEILEQYNGHASPTPVIEAGRVYGPSHKKCPIGVDRK